MKWKFFSIDLKKSFLENNSFRDAETWLETSSGKVNSSFFKSWSLGIWWGHNGGWILIAKGTVEHNIIRNEYIEENFLKNQIYLASLTENHQEVLIQDCSNHDSE